MDTISQTQMDIFRRQIRQIVKPYLFTDILLTRSENSLMKLLENKENGFVSRDEIAIAIWDEKSCDKYSNWAIDKLISRLRGKLILNGYSAGTIKTVKGRGYRYIED